MRVQSLNTQGQSQKQNLMEKQWDEQLKIKLQSTNDSEEEISH